MATGGEFVTATDVANRAGVSQSTVSRVFNPDSRLLVRDKTRKKVLEAAEELGYVPNAIAQTMASGRSRIIGIVVPSNYNIFHYHILQILTNVFQMYDLRTMVFTSAPTDNINDLLQNLYQYQVDGVIVTSAVLGQNVTGSWTRKGMPVILFNSDLPDAEVSMVQSNHFHSGEQMAEYLTAMGYQRFAYVTAEKSPHLNLRSRQEGFLSGLIAHGIDKCQIIPAAYSYKSGWEAGTFLLSQKDVPDAIFCSGDINGFGVIDAIRQQTSLRLGFDIGVSGYDAPIIGDFQGYSMTALAQPTTQLARDAVEMLLQLIAEPETPKKKIIRPMKLIIRTSTQMRKHQAEQNA